MSSQPSGAKQTSGPGHPASLDLNGDNRTRWSKRLSGSVSDGDVDGGECEPETEPENWSRQQKRVFHRLNTILHYWESRDYEIVWVTLTSSPDSDPADRLAYNVRRLRQTIERARVARDADGRVHQLSHLDELEQLAIRTSEGPPGKGVMHLFWAWQPLDGQHSRRLHIPQWWLSRQWGRIHGGESLLDNAEARQVLQGDSKTLSAAAETRLWVWISQYGEPDYHDRKSIARYCVTQYLGEHAEALEHVSWSHGRTLGGSLLEAWNAVRRHSESLDTAIERWERVIAGEAVTVGPSSDHVHYGLRVIPPPNLGVEETSAVEIHPPRDYTPSGPDANTVRTLTPSLTEVDPAESRECPSCGARRGLTRLPTDPDLIAGGDVHPVIARDETDRVSVQCQSCKDTFALPGDGDPVVSVKEFEWTQERQTTLSEFAGFDYYTIPQPRETASVSSTPSISTGVSSLLAETRARTDAESPLGDGRTWRDEMKIFIGNHPGASVWDVLARTSAPPSRKSYIQGFIERKSDR